MSEAIRVLALPTLLSSLVIVFIEGLALVPLLWLSLWPWIALRTRASGALTLALFVPSLLLAAFVLASPFVYGDIPYPTVVCAGTCLIPVGVVAVVYVARRSRPVAAPPSAPKKALVSFAWVLVAYLVVGTLWLATLNLSPLRLPDMNQIDLWGRTGDVMLRVEDGTAVSDYYVEGVIVGRTRFNGFPVPVLMVTKLRGTGSPDLGGYRYIALNGPSKSKIEDAFPPTAEERLHRYARVSGRLVVHSGMWYHLEE